MVKICKFCFTRTFVHSNFCPAPFLSMKCTSQTCLTARNMQLLWRPCRLPSRRCRTTPGTSMPLEHCQHLDYYPQPGPRLNPRPDFSFPNSTIGKAKLIVKVGLGVLFQSCMKLHKLELLLWMPTPVEQAEIRPNVLISQLTRPSNSHTGSTVYPLQNCTRNTSDGIFINPSTTG